MKTLASLIFTLITLSAFGQNQTASAERFIEVTGEGEVKVDPDIIFLSIELKEYKKDGKIVKLDDLEAQLIKVLQAVNIPKENLKAFASSGRQFDVKKRKADLLIGKRYKLKLTDIDLLNPFLGGLSETDILAVSITEVTHTDIDKYKTESKVKAVNNVKEKAVLMTSNLESKLGQVLYIRETELVDAYPLEALNERAAGLRGAGTSGLYRVSYEERPIARPSVDFEQIKLTYKIVVKFRIE
jgi:uncharacterized protein